jgi:hypothetical protein
MAKKDLNEEAITIDKDALNTLIGNELGAFLSQMASQTAKEGVTGEKTTGTSVQTDISDPGHAERIQAAVARGNDLHATMQAFMLSDDRAFTNVVKYNSQNYIHSLNMAHSEIASALGKAMVDHRDTSFDKTVNIDETSAWLNRIFRNENFADALQVAVANLVNAVWEKMVESKED